MNAMRLSVSDIADAIEAGLRRKLDQLELEQPVYGLDVLEEIALQPMLGDALREAGYGVHREQRYPAERKRRRFSEGERCDFVLTPQLRDLAQPDAEGTLFDSADAVPLDEAFWLEAKLVSQFTIEGANNHYSSQLLSTVRQDVLKLSKDPGILKAGILIVLFVRDRSVAEHDLDIWQDRCLSRGLPIGAPSMRFIPIVDRHGNSVCAIAVYPVSHI